MGALGELLRDFINFEENRTECPPFLCGYIDEKLLKVYGKVKSGVQEGKKRPFMVVYANESFCYLILFTTSSFRFPCKRDRYYGIEGDTPSIEWKDYCKKNADCERAFKLPVSRLYKLIFLDNDCRIVLRIPKRFLSEESFVKCGIYPEGEIPREIKEIVRGELERWGI